MTIVNRVLMNTSVRQFLWRASRIVYTLSRGEKENDPRRNGEYRLIDEVLKGASSNSAHVNLIDVGANKGDWSATVTTKAKSSGTLVNLHLFEPAPDTLHHLETRFKNNKAIFIKPFAVSDVAGSALFYYSEGLKGTNSLSPLNNASELKVTVTTLDDYLESESIMSVSLIKCDAEGNDLNVLRGAYKSLESERIMVIQFEYNHRWISNRHYLKDVFDLVDNLPYFVGRLCAHQIEIFDKWNPELERYFEDNYVLVHKDAIRSFCISTPLTLQNTYKRIF